eukprot:3143147-Lingulodinium_polyedra.AAC.1
MIYAATSWTDKNGGCLRRNDTLPSPNRLGEQAWALPEAPGAPRPVGDTTDTERADAAAST